MKIIFKTILAFIAITISACSTDDAVTPPPLAPVTNGSAGFSWRENDPASITIQNATTASFSTQLKTLIAKNVAGNTIFEINLTGTTAGTYNFGSGTGNALTFTVPSQRLLQNRAHLLLQQTRMEKCQALLRLLDLVITPFQGFMELLQTLP